MKECLIVLGSNFKEKFEVDYDFLKSSQATKIDVISIDQIPLQDYQETLIKEKYSIYRLSTDCTNTDDVYNFIRKISVTGLNSYSKITIVDSIHYLYPFKYSKKIAEHIFAKEGICQLRQVHYISADCENPTINGNAAVIREEDRSTLLNKVEKFDDFIQFTSSKKDILKRMLAGNLNNNENWIEFRNSCNVTLNNWNTKTNLKDITNFYNDSLRGFLCQSINGLLQEQLSENLERIIPDSLAINRNVSRENKLMPNECPPQQNFCFEGKSARNNLHSFWYQKSISEAKNTEITRFNSVMVP